MKSGSLLGSICLTMLCLVGCAAREQVVRDPSLDPELEALLDPELQYETAEADLEVPGASAFAERDPLAEESPAFGSLEAKVETAPSRPVNLNTASVAQLDAVPGLDRATAERIVQYRSRSGRFTSVDQLMQVQGMSEETLESVRRWVTVESRRKRR